MSADTTGVACGHTATEHLTAGHPTSVPVSIAYADVTLDGLAAVVDLIRTMPATGWSMLAAAQTDAESLTVALAHAHQAAAHTGRADLLTHATSQVHAAADQNPSAGTGPEYHLARHVLACAVTAMVMGDVIDPTDYTCLLAPVHRAQTASTVPAADKTGPLQRLRRPRRR